MKPAPSHTILAANDRTNQPEAMASIIELAEYAVLKATNVTAALRLALKHEPDRIVSDVSKQQAAVDLPPRLRSDHNLRDSPILPIKAKTVSHPEYEIDSFKDELLEILYRPITLPAEVAKLFKRKRTQYELRRSQEHYFKLLHNANDIVYSEDLHGLQFA